MIDNRSVSSAAQIASALLEDDGEDPKDFVMRQPPRLPPTPRQVQFYMWVEEEDRDPDWDEPNDPDDLRAHRQMMRDIRRRLARGDNWAFGVVFVMAVYRDPNDGRVYYGDDVLGGCSYKDAEDFMQPGDYFDDMKHQAYEELLKRFEAGKSGPRVPGHTPPPGTEVPEEYSKLS